MEESQSQMCGISALFSTHRPLPVGAIESMTSLVRHRGPDGEGFAFFVGNEHWLRGGPDTPSEFLESTPTRYAPQSGKPATGMTAALGHRRLAVIDLSASGHQPMSDPQERYWISYNGEVYNYLELRAELEKYGHHFVSNTDTEVVLAAVLQWGIESLARLNGMFAFVLYDRHERRIFAVRDRFGVKPLYWWQSPDGLLAFASEIKQFTCLPGWTAKLNGQRAYDFLNWGLADHTGETMFAGVGQVPGGHYVEIDLGASDGPIQPRSWFERSKPEPLDIDFNSAARCFGELFRESIRLRLRADVPVGTGLSGGLDSSSIVCTVAEFVGACKNRRHNSFSARSDDPDYDEGPFIEAVVAQTGVRHHEVRPEPGGALASLPELVWHQDEPFGAASVYAQWLVFKLTAEVGIKVTLDGHGSDEYLAGYHTFFASRLRELLSAGRLSLAVKEYAAIRARHGHGAGLLIGYLLDGLAPNWLRNAMRCAAGRTSFHPEWLSLTTLGAQASDPYRTAPGGAGSVADFSISHLHAIGLPHMLHWSDRSSMAVSVESREPFLDHNLVSFSLALPSQHKNSLGVTKRVLRAGLKDVLPEMVRKRMDKKGFITPEERWITRDCPQDFLAAARDTVSNGCGIFTASALTRCEQMVEKNIAYHASFWRLICFGAWMKRFSVQVG